MNLTEITVVNDTKLTQPQKNLLAMLHEKYRVRIYPEEFEVRRNPVNGVPSHPLNPVVGVLVDVVLRAYANYERGQMSVNDVKMSIGVFDRIKLLVLALDNKAYSILID